MNKYLSLKPFSTSEAENLIEYLHSACNEDDHKRFLEGSLLGEYSDYEKYSYDRELMYSQFIVRFVKFLNKDSAAHKRARFVVRKQWETSSLPKCQIRAICDYVEDCVRRREDHAQAKRYLATRYSSNQEFKRVARRIESLQRALKNEDELLKQEFNFPPVSEEITPILELIIGCSQAISEIQTTRRSLYSEQRFGAWRFALQKIRAAKALANPHSKQNHLSSVQVSEIMPVLHEVITGKFPEGSDFRQYSAANLMNHANRLDDDETRVKLKEIMESIVEKYPRLADSPEDSACAREKRIPKMVRPSDDSVAILLLSRIHAEYRNSNDPTEFVGKLEGLELALHSLL